MISSGLHASNGLIGSLSALTSKLFSYCDGDGFEMTGY